MILKRIIFTTASCILSGLIFLYFLKWDWSFFIIPVLMALSISLTNFDLISIRKKFLGIILHVSLSIILFFVTIGSTFALSTEVGHPIVFYLGCAFGAVFLTLITNVILPFPKFWKSLLIISILSLLAFPLATCVHEISWGITPILNGRENISIFWMFLVGLGIAIGIHWKR